VRDVLQRIGNVGDHGRVAVASASTGRRGSLGPDGTGIKKACGRGETGTTIKKVDHLADGLALSMADETTVETDVLLVSIGRGFNSQGIGLDGARSRGGARQGGAEPALGPAATAGKAQAPSLEKEKGEEDEQEERAGIAAAAANKRRKGLMKFMTNYTLAIAARNHVPPSRRQALPRE
jgi:hypothetical protein